MNNNKEYKHKWYMKHKKLCIDRAREQTEGWDVWGNEV